MVYTSASRGLFGGTSGFCVVAATEGLPEALQRRLETLSSYVPGPDSARSIDFAHTRLRLQGSVWHVLSRVTSCGHDYSGRANKIAHHLALREPELTALPEGPGGYCDDDRFWFSEWESEPMWLAADRLPQADSGASPPGSVWKREFGDAGIAGPLLAAACDAAASVTVVVPAAADMLRLAVDGLRLVEPGLRWGVTFDVGSGRGRSAAGYRWRFVREGSPAAVTSGKRPGDVLLVPAAGLPAELAADPYVVAARAGRAVGPGGIRRPDRQRGAASPKQISDPPSGGGRPRPSQVRRREAGARARAARAAARSGGGGESVHHVDLDGLSPGANRRRGGRIWLLGLALLLVTLGSVVAVWYCQSSDRSQAVEGSPPVTAKDQ